MILPESRTPFDICNETAKYMGISNFSDLTDEQWVKQTLSQNLGIIDYDSFKIRSTYKLKMAKPFVAFKVDKSGGLIKTPSA